MIKAEILKFNKNNENTSTKKKVYNDESTFDLLLRSRFTKSEKRDISAQLDEYGACDIRKACYEYRFVKI